jgi:putative oxygen-independent coproporphyrinogen III oxidase
MTALPPLSLYIHFPWCVAKCPYCDFNSHSLQGELPAADYITALLADLDAAARVLAGRKLVSVFMGGGTPSLFPPPAIGRLLAVVRDYFELLPGAEVTMEANPGAVEHGAFAGYREAGVNRLSLGVQSFADAKLKSLGRIHDAAAAYGAYADARGAGFDNINLDLMYALPGQTLQEARVDIEEAIALQPEHISYYHLTLEANTVFYARPPALPDEDLAWDIQQQAMELLGTAGFENYEVSAWGRSGRQCQHNLNYWRYGDYLGLGAGAHSKITSANGSVVRENRSAHPRDYLRRVHVQQATSRQDVDAANKLFEFMLNNLRLRAGFTRSDFERATGLPASLLAEGLNEALAKGLLSEKPGGLLQPTSLGWQFLDNLQSIFLPEQ